MNVKKELEDDWKIKGNNGNRGHCSDVGNDEIKILQNFEMTYIIIVVFEVVYG